jgi:type II secretory pathway pseudopilin PulG
MANLQSASRRGITLMEVLISIGILAIGLSSVLSLIPAGKAQVTQAIIYDRATNLAANALADAATFGLLKPESLQLSDSNVLIFDPSDGATLASGTAWLKPRGIYSAGTSPSLSTGNSRIVARLFSQSRDDLVYTLPTSDDALPSNQFPSTGPGPRSYQGRTSCMIAVTSTAPFAAGTFATLSAVVFHNRDLSPNAPLSVTGTCDASSSVITVNMATAPADRAIREIVRPGTVVTTGTSFNTSFHQLTMAAVDASTNSAFVTFSGSLPPGGSTVYILLDSVGLSQQSVLLEGPGPWSQ